MPFLTLPIHDEALRSAMMTAILRCCLSIDLGEYIG